MRVKKKNTVDKIMANPRSDKLRVLPRSQVSEPTRAPYVVWSTKMRMIVSEHPNKASAVSSLSKLRKDIKKGVYD
jgi:hypothetical protein